MTPNYAMFSTEQIVDYLDRETAQIDRLKGEVEASIDLLQRYRTALVSAAVTGRIDVRRAVARGDAIFEGMVVS